MRPLFHNIYHNKNVLLTGHTGFKGSWMSLWLEKLGAKVTGFSLSQPSEPFHFSLLRSGVRDERGDIGDYKSVEAVLRNTQPEIVFHFAAQPLVRRSYQDPIGTYRTNVLGSLNLLEACRNIGGIQAVVMITTDKCYENKEWVWGYRENDRLGGYDPYSSSKACCEIMTASFRNSYPSEMLIATCRAGNVIGGGDWAADRLIPDLIRAAAKNETTKIRMPGATRPWQHVLEPLSGYLLLGQYLLENKKTFADAWNFGPGTEGNRTVKKVTEIARSCWERINVDLVPDSALHEASNLMLDCSKAKRYLHWTPTWEIEQGIVKTIEWYKTFYETGNIISAQQLETFIENAQKAGHCWTK
ncbi:MAG: CDP-glucose 4,6-dehydratase [Planctomycetaceae bacterium]|jgi:CDP-glucose 4,6-dehydratase|nr:CDP-glucose 4,6-dehydratase [Planctomycetaceae bacterium]